MKPKRKKKEKKPFNPAALGAFTGIAGGLTSMVGGMVGGEAGAHIANAGSMASNMGSAAATGDYGGMLGAAAQGAT